MGCHIELHILESNSLKDKRRVLKSIKDRIRNAFNVAIAEVDDGDLWQSASIGVVTVSNQVRHANEVLSKVINFIERDLRIELVDYDMEVY
jgi:uncharacterized protein YlxP (DUF503 family)